MRRFTTVCIVGSLLACGALAWADDTSGISSGIQPGQPWVDDGSTLFPGSDRDLDFSDDTPHLTLRDSDTNVAWELHVEDAASDPYRGLTVWQGTQSASGGTFTIGTAKPTLRVNQSGTLFFDLLQTVSAARCLELNASGQVTLASAACGSGGAGDSLTVGGVAATDPDFIAGDITWTLDVAATPDTIVGTVGANAVALTTDTTGNYAAGDAEAGAALTGDSATNFFSIGQMAVARTLLTAGRSLTLTTDDVAADAETFTTTKCYRIADPVATDDDKSIFVADGYAATVTRLWCESDQTTTMMGQIDDGTPADMDTVDLVCISTQATDTALNGDATLASGDRIDIDIASVSGTPTFATICFTMTLDD